MRYYISFLMVSAQYDEFIVEFIFRLSKLEMVAIETDMMGCIVNIMDLHILIQSR